MSPELATAFGRGGDDRPCRRHERHEGFRLLIGVGAHSSLPPFEISDLRPCVASDTASLTAR
eukprot:14337191-Alexandrium_andersonii.AAC.1